MDTYQEAEVAEDGLLYWIGKEIVTGEWKPSGDMGASAARTTRREDVGTRVFYSFRLRR